MQDGRLRAARWRPAPHSRAGSGPSSAVLEILRSGRRSGISQALSRSSMAVRSRPTPTPGSPSVRCSGSGFHQSCGRDQAGRVNWKVSCVDRKPQRCFVEPADGGKALCLSAGVGGAGADEFLTGPDSFPRTCGDEIPLWQ